jgi:hypothetical protein
MKKNKLTAKESKIGIRSYALYIKNRNKKYLNGLKVTYEEVKV